METTALIIKPEALTYAEEIKEIIQQGDLTIVASRKLVLPHHAINILYPELSSQLHEITLSIFRNEVEIGLIKGTDAIKNFFLLSGTETSPSLCAPHTIRFRFGKKTPRIVGNYQYFENAIHRPKNLEEAKRDVEMIKNLLR